MFSNIEYFLVIKKCGNLSAAAKELGISQPALSSYLKKLETRLGFALFDRNKNPMILTELGKVYYSYVKKNVLLEEDFKNEIEEFADRSHNNLTIAGAVSTNIFFLSKIMSKFLEEFPYSQVKIIDGKVADIFDIAVYNNIDFFITPDVRPDNIFEYIPLSWERIILSIPEGWEINKELKEYQLPVDELLNGSIDYEAIPSLPFKKLKKCTFVLMDSETNIRKSSDMVFADNGFSPTRFIQVDQMLTGFYMTLNNSGISFISDSMVSTVKCDKYPCFYKLEGDYLKRMLYICYKKDRYLSKSAKRMIELLINNKR